MVMLAWSGDTVTPESSVVAATNSLSVASSRTLSSKILTLKVCVVWPGEKVSSTSDTGL